MKINRFEDIEVWQLARLLVKKIYLLTQSEKFLKDYGLSGQIQRSAVSIMANIAEGFERKSKKEFIQFLNIAKASGGELRSHLYIAFDLEYITKDAFDDTFSAAEQISKSLAGFMKYLNSMK